MCIYTCVYMYACSMIQHNALDRIRIAELGTHCRFAHSPFLMNEILPHLLQTLARTGVVGDGDLSIVCF